MSSRLICHCEALLKRHPEGRSPEGSRPAVFYLLVICLFISSFSHAAEDYFFKANELYDQGKFKESIPLYRAAIDEGRYEPFAWFNLGNAMVQLDRKQVAMVAYKRTVELLPNFEKAWMLLGRWCCSTFQVQ